jgi:hypothetical protein
MSPMKYTLAVLTIALLPLLMQAPVRAETVPQPGADEGYASLFVPVARRCYGAACRGRPVRPRACPGRRGYWPNCLSQPKRRICPSGLKGPNCDVLDIR